MELMFFLLIVQSQFSDILSLDSLWHLLTCVESGVLLLWFGLVLIFGFWHTSEKEKSMVSPLPRIFAQFLPNSYVNKIQLSKF